MFSRLSRSRGASTAAHSAAVPPGQRIYAIGDVHGRLDLTDALLAIIAADDARRPAADTQLIFLGDLVDRGPDSAGVVERLCALRDARPNTRFLLGNHEEVFLAVLGGDTRALSMFSRIGGRETILSYGVSEADYHGLDAAALIDRLNARVPRAHVDFLRGFEDMIVVGDYAFVHAGVDPHRPLDDQRPADLRWIRDRFLSHGAPLAKMVVHGHTISEAVEQTAHRIGIDTGAYATGRLTALMLEGTERALLQAVE